MSVLPKSKFLRYLVITVVILALLLLFLPALASPLIRSRVEGAFAERFQGQLQIESVDLAWNSRQQLRSARLLDAEGTEVARADLELPSLLDLARSGSAGLGLISMQLQARLVADDQGQSNWQRALEPRVSAPAKRSDNASAQPEEPASAWDPAQLQFEFVLTAPLLAWSDTNTRELGKDFEIRDLWLRVRAERGQALDCEMRGTIAGAGSGSLQGRAQVQGLSTDTQKPFTQAQANFEVRGLSCALIDGLLRQNGDLAALLGSNLDASLALQASGLDSGTLALGVSSERTRLDLKARLEQGVVRWEDERGAELSLLVPWERWQPRLAARLPAGYGLECPDPDLRVLLRLPALETDLNFSQLGWAEWGQRLRAQLQLQIPGPFGLRAPALEQHKLRPLVRDVLLRAACSPKQAPEFSLAMLLDTGVAGTLRVSASAPELWSALARGEPPLCDAQLQCVDLSCAFVDALLGQGDLLHTGAGRALDIQLKANQASLAGAELDLSVRSANLDLRVRGQLDPHSLRSSGEQGVDLLYSPPPAWWGRFLPAEVAGLSTSVQQSRLRLGVRELDLPLSFNGLEELAQRCSAALTLELPGVALEHAGETLRIAQPKLTLSIAKGGALGLRMESALNFQTGARLDLLAELPSWLALTRGELPPISADLGLDELDLVRSSKLLGLDLGLAERLGERADLRLRTQRLALEGGQLDIALTASKLSASAHFEGQQHVFQGRADLRCQWSAQDWATEWARFAPADCQVAPLDAQPLTCELSAIQLHMPAREQWGDAQAWLQALQGSLRLSIPPLAVEHPALRDQQLQLRVGSTQVAASIEAGKAQLELEGSLEDQRASYAALVGNRLTWKLRGNGDLSQQQLGLNLESERLRFALNLQRNAQGLALQAPAGLDLEWRPDVQHAQAEWARLLPANLRLVPLDPNAFALRLQTSEFALGNLAEGAAWLSQARGKLEFGLPDLRLEVIGQEDAALVLNQTRLALDLAGEQPSGLQVAALLNPDASGRLQLSVKPHSALTRWGESDFRFGFQLRANAVPLAVVDALVEPQGLLLEMLGSKVDLELAGDPMTLDSGVIIGSARSEQFSVALDAEVGKTALRITKPQGVVANFGLGPLSSDRFLGGVLPMICAVSKPTESKPARLVIDALQFPMDGDLQGLDARLVLELGDIDYSWLPGLNQFFGNAVSNQRTRLGAVPIAIEKGVVRYDRLPLKLGGREVLVQGSYQLYDQQLALQFSVPLELLGKKVSKELEKARDFLDPKLSVPIEIRGSATSPKLSLGKGFVESVVQKALEKQLQKGLEGLLGGKPKKD